MRLSTIYEDNPEDYNYSKNLFIEKLPLYRRKHYSIIHEPLNTFSNFIFIILGTIRFLEVQYNFDYESGNLYKFFVTIGFCSAIHHSTIYKWTFIIEYLPILLGAYYGWKIGVLYTMSLGSLFILLCHL